MARVKQHRAYLEVNFPQNRRVLRDPRIFVHDVQIQRDAGELNRLANVFRLLSFLFTFLFPDEIVRL